MKHKAATALLAGGLALGAFVGDAHAGQYTYYRECAPNGDTIVYITAWDGPTTIYIDGIQTSMLVTGPGEHVIEYWGYPTSDGVRVPGPDVVWNTYRITIEPSNCEQPTTTAPEPTTTEAAPTTSEASTTTPPTAPVATTAPVNETVCLDEPAGCEPPADVTGTTVPTLPATGQDNTALLAAAGALLAIGTTLVLIRRRPA